MTRGLVVDEDSAGCTGLHTENFCETYACHPPRNGQPAPVDDRLALEGRRLRDRDLAKPFCWMHFQGHAHEGSQLSVLHQIGERALRLGDGEAEL